MIRKLNVHWEKMYDLYYIGYRSIQTVKLLQLFQISEMNLQLSQPFVSSQITLSCSQFFLMQQYEISQKVLFSSLIKGQSRYYKEEALCKMRRC